MLSRIIKILSSDFKYLISFDHNWLNWVNKNLNIDFA